MLLTEDELNERIEVFKRTKKGVYICGLVAGLEMAKGGLSGFWDFWKRAAEKNPKGDGEDVNKVRL